MIRPFSLRDLGLVRRLSDQGTLLHAESALTRSCQPLRGALFSMLSRRDSSTYIWREKAGDAAGFVQLYLPEGQTFAHLLCLGATPANSETESDTTVDPLLNETAWLSLLEGAIAAVGQRGIHSLIAEVDESGPELPILRRAGFAVYTRQDIWLLEAPSVGEDGVTAGTVIANSDSASPTSTEEETPERPLLQLSAAADEWEVEWLYANTVPPLIQLVEPTPPQHGQIWILRDEQELTAFVHIQEGSIAAWIQIFIHPNAYDQSSAIVRAAVELCHPDSNKAIYCCVRRYQSWLQHPLKESGFERCKSQAVMVKHIANPVQSKVGELKRLLQAQRAQATSMLIQYGKREEKRPKLLRD